MLATVKSFRDRVATVDAEGRRVWLYPRLPKGELYKWRVRFSYLQLGLLVAGPFIRIRGEPLLMLNIVERKFVILGQVFWPQDFHLFAVLMLIWLVSVIVVTALFGRIWCGWLCPQTVLMEMLFRRIETFIEGQPNHRRKRDAGPWTAEKVRVKLLKHSVFFALSFVAGNIFLAYIIGSDELIDIITDPPSEHIVGLSLMLLHTAAFYWMYARFREQFCTMLCPYARIQSVLLDDDSLVVAYDQPRGEPRGKRSRAKDADNSEKGDCVDCGICQQVCPTGIDIRNGSPQLECINCTACIDGCNGVMGKLGRAPNLIKLTSMNAVSGKPTRRFTPRVVAYCVVLALLTVAFVGLLAGRADTETTLLRTPGQLFQRNADGTIQNLYNAKVLNKGRDPLTVQFTLLSHQGTITPVGWDDSIRASAESTTDLVLFIRIPEHELAPGRNQIRLALCEGERQLEVFETSFINSHAAAPPEQP
jgi:cytochrome c oxidase accessory protein FixG